MADNKMEKINYTKPSITETQDITKHRKAKNREARHKAKERKARRKVNENWQRIEATGKYRKAIARSAGWNTTNRIVEEVLDGIFLNLNARNAGKSVSEQKRILRRIVEKRQAQALHVKTKKCRGRNVSTAVNINSSECLKQIHDLQYMC